MSSLFKNVSRFVIFKTCYAKIFHIPIPNIIKISFTPTFSSDMQLKPFLFQNFSSNYSSFSFCTDYRLMLIAAFSQFLLAQKNFCDDLSHLGVWVNLYFLNKFLIPSTLNILKLSPSSSLLLRYGISFPTTIFQSFLFPDDFWHFFLNCHSDSSLPYWQKYAKDAIWGRL